MGTSLECHKCGSEISALRVAACWPTKIVCRACQNTERYRFGHFVGFLYLVALFPLSLAPIFYSYRFTRVENGIYYSWSFIQYIIAWGGAAIVYLAVALIYANMMKKFFVLRSDEGSVKP
jgi:hypothetical protein